MKMLEGRTAVVVGGAGSIGGAICTLFAEHGARVLVADVVGDRVQTVLDQIHAGGGSASGLVADLTTEQAMAQLAEQAAALGPTDILVNCLGHYLDSVEPFENTTEKTWQALYEINLLPVLRACHAFLPGMKAQHYGRIINFSSTEGIRASPSLAVYGAFKGAVDAFTRSLAVEAARDGVIVNSIAADKTRSYQTNFLQVPPEYEHLIPTWTPRGRFADGEDIAKIALFLASDLCDWVVGSTLLADGGTIAAGGWYRTPQRWSTQPLLHQFFEPAEANLSRPRSLQ
jgi:NAD(P)-dependent dehydrogenase (short-subunit alcohol dehydrogenase family)